MDDEEIVDLARSDAVVVLCPSTEANLGDGLFPLHPYLAAGGRIAIGSDSHISINPFEELRWLEYGQRLASQSRNVVSLRDSHVGSELFARALEGGARASGQDLVGLREGAPADLVALADDDPMLAGHSDESRLDALVFSGYPLPVERVMVAGRWCVIDAEHVDRERTRREFAEALDRLGVAS
jgi:formimidoylglutamate deiminase